MQVGLPTARPCYSSWIRTDVLSSNVASIMHLRLEVNTFQAIHDQWILLNGDLGGQKARSDTEESKSIQRSNLEGLLFPPWSKAAVDLIV
jgi:hypothetical protein